MSCTKHMTDGACHECKIELLEKELATLKASLPKIKADAASNYLEYLEYCKRISIDNPTEPLEYLAGLEKLEAGE